MDAIIRRMFAIAALAVLTGLAGGALAQGVIRSVHNDWQIRCDTPPGAQYEQCALIQSVIADDRPNVGLTVLVMRTADQKFRLMRVIAPPGVLLPSGLGLWIDQTEVGRAGFVRCIPIGCITEVILKDDLILESRSGKVPGARAVAFTNSTVNRSPENLI